MVPPTFVIRDGYAVYRGPAPDRSPLHRHGAFQIAVAVSGEVAMVDGAQTCHRGAALVIAPMTEHRILATPAQITYYVEPYCAFADRLRVRYGPGISAAPELRNLRERDIGAGGGGPSRELDARLVHALEVLRDNDITMPAVAAAVGVSPQHLRVLARRQLGMPLTRWRVWTRLRRATEALQAGASLADAAVVAGFADQAHLTRQMREMMGLTPAAVAAAVHTHTLTAT